MSVDQHKTCFTLDHLQYNLPQELIAQHPLERRDSSRLLVLDRSGPRLHDGFVRDLPQLLRPDDLLVLNDTKVLPARFTARRCSGGRVDGLFLAEVTTGDWDVMLTTSKRLRCGEVLFLEHCRAGHKLMKSKQGTARAEGRRMPDPMETFPETGMPTLQLKEHLGEGRWRVSVSPTGSAEEILEQFGRTPLPPYIRREYGTNAEMEGDTLLTHSDETDRVRYQTVYARRPGAVAAPTAGLHLTEELLDRLRRNGVQTAFVTLHVGPGTFQPIRLHDVSRHLMHAEWYELPAQTARAIRTCRSRGGRVVAVGTTVVRVLESAARESETWYRHPAGEETEEQDVGTQTGRTELFIYPPFRFRVVDALMTNFHLPGSTLLAMVMAIAGENAVRTAYQHAIEQGYRFYSFGDAMLIL